MYRVHTVRVCTAHSDTAGAQLALCTIVPCDGAGILWCGREKLKEPSPPAEGCCQVPTLAPSKMHCYIDSVCSLSALVGEWSPRRLQWKGHPTFAHNPPPPPQSLPDIFTPAPHTVWRPAQDTANHVKPGVPTGKLTLRLRFTAAPCAWAGPLLLLLFRCCFVARGGGGQRSKNKMCT